MVSKASDDLPEPDSPVSTTSRSRGRSRSMFLRLCSRAPRMERYLLSMMAPARRTPALQRSQRFVGRLPPDDRIDRDILVEIRPMHALAAPDQAPIAALRGGRLGQTRIPAQRDRDRSPIRKNDAQRNVGCL